MRIANYEGRLVVVTGEAGHELAHDVEKASNGRFGPDPQAIYEDWDGFIGWAGATRRAASAGKPAYPSGPMASARRPRRRARCSASG